MITTHLYRNMQEQVQQLTATKHSLEEELAKGMLASTTSS